MTAEGPFRIDEEATEARLQQLGAWRRELPPKEAALRIAHVLGAHSVNGGAHFAFWLPEVTAAARVELELLHPEEEIAFEGERRARFTRRRLPLSWSGDVALVAVDGVRPGTRERAGTLYRLRIVGHEGDVRVRGDPLAASLPFGVHGPAELYDVDLAHAGRDDRAYLRHVALAAEDEAPRMGPPGPVLEVHVGTATHGGTLADLAELYRGLGEKVRAGAPLSPAERAFVGYDAVQLLPLEPVPEDRTRPPRFEAFEAPEDGDTVFAALRFERGAQWGFDAPLFGAAALQPALLRSGRPDELVDLSAALHTFPGKPMGLFLDLRLAPVHPQGAALLPDGFVEGPQDALEPALGHPMVRALLLEMQRRKGEYGADGVRLRLGGAHRVWSEAAGGLVRDEAFVREAADLVHEVADVRYRPSLVRDDGTVPAEAAAGEEDEGTLHRVPLTASGRLPLEADYWHEAWPRLERLGRHGALWTHGYADHEALARAHRVPLQGDPDPAEGDRAAWARRAFDLPAATLWAHAALPGVPVTFVAASLRAPWTFLRDAVDRHRVKAAAEEAGFFAWRGDETRFERPDVFPRTKALGFTDPGVLAGFLEGLRSVLLESGEGRTEDVAREARERGLEAPVPVDSEHLRTVATALLEDLHEYCVVWRFEGELDEAQVDFDLAVRRFRRERPWLRRTLRGGERLERRVRDEDGLVGVALRSAPDGGEEVGVLANLVGGPWTVVPADLLGDAAGWEPAVVAPGVAWEGAGSEVTLHPGSGVLVVRRA